MTTFYNWVVKLSVHVFFLSGPQTIFFWAPAFKWVRFMNAKYLTLGGLFWLFSFCMKQCIQCISFLNLFSFWFNRLHWQTMNSARIALCTGTSFQIWPILPELHAKTSQHFEENSTANFAVYLLLIPDEIFSFPEKIASTINLWWMLFFQERRIFHLEIEHDCI